MNVFDYVRLNYASFPSVDGELPYQHINRVLSSLGMSNSYQDCGSIIEIVDANTVVFQDWQKQVTITIDKKHLSLCKLFDVNDKELFIDDVVWLCVGNKMVSTVFVGIRGWSTPEGYPVLGGIFKRLDNDKKIIHYHASGRLKI